MKYFVKHLDAVGEGYWQHFKHAMSFSLKLLYAGIVCMLHAIFPFLFEKTGSKMICELYECMVANRNNLTADCDKKRASKATNHTNDQTQQENLTQAN
jgi:hypothetical protein